MLNEHVHLPTRQKDRQKQIICRSKYTC